MAPIKFEEQIKDKLEKRTVAPSPEAWSKLSQQLDAEDKRNKKSTFWWFGVAASIAALIFVTLTYFGNSTDTETKDIIVKEDIKELVEPTKTEELVTNDNKSVEESIAQTAPEKEEPKPRVQALKKVKKQNNAVARVKPEVVIPVDRTDLEKQAKEDLTNIEAVEFNAVAKVIKEAKTQKELKVTDQQIDSLLKEANRELLIDRALKSKSNIVDADALLQDVEEEMGQSFRTRIYETLKDSYKSVKSAVARRNN